MAQASDTIAFMGLEGANADLACRKSQPYMHTLPCASFEDVFEVIESGRAALGLIPIENSQAGRVAEIHNILPRTNLHIVGEYFQHIELCLMAPKGAKPENIKEIYSHPQALLQCRETLKGYPAERFQSSSTAQAAKNVADWKDVTKAAIASPLAAELYGLQVLENHFEDADDNTTVYIVIGAEAADPNPAKEKHILTTLLFTVRNIPAALYKALGGFATNNVNIIKLESYIPAGKSPNDPSASQFFLSFEGHPQETRVQQALEELGFFSRRVKVLGVYPAHEKRYG